MSHSTATTDSFSSLEQGHLSESDSLKRLVYRLGLLVAFLIPIKLSFTYIVLLPMLGIWAFCYFNERQWIGRAVKDWALPFYLFLFVAALSGLFGLEPLGSAFHLLRLGVVFAVSIMFWTIASKNRFKGLAAALLTGQFVSALHTITEAAFPEITPPFFHGAVSESGQLAITIIFAFGLWMSQLREAQQEVSVKQYREMALGCGVASLLAYSSWLGFASPLKVTIFALCLGYLLWQLKRIRTLLHQSNRLSAFSLFLSGIILPFLLAALVVNLKRGPWAGVTCGMAVLLLFHHRRLLFPFLAAASVVVLSFKPVAARILDMPAHFFMSGGRGTIWDIGLELAIRFPLGIGFDNSGVLRQFSSDVPEVLDHFHSNFLNILVETGWAGLALFVWWLVAVVRSGFGAIPTSILGTTLLAIVVSWQVAGLAEYNFGDSEVLLTVLLVVGILLGFLGKKSIPQADGEISSLVQGNQP